MSDRFGTISIDPALPNPPKRPHKSKPSPRPTPKKANPRPQQPRRRIILLAIPISLIFIYGLCGFFLGPSLLVGHLSSALQQTFGTGLTAGEAHFNPFTLRLQLHDISTTTTDNQQPPAPETPLLHIDHLLTDLNLISLLRNGIACKRLEIQGLTLSLIRHPDKSYNLPALIAADKSKTEPESLSLSRLPLLFSLNNIKISDSRIFYDDRLTNKKHSVEQINLDLPTLSNFSFAAKEYIHPHFSAVINGSPVELVGEAALPGENGRNEMKTNLSCNVENLDLPLYFAYLPKSLPLALGKGKGTGKIQIAFLPKDKKGGHLTIGFQLAATDIELTNPDQTLALNASTMQIDGSMQPFDGALHIRNLHLLQPQFSADQTRFSENMAQLFSGATTEESPGKKRQHLAIDTLTVDNGTLQFSDKEAQSAATPPWTAIQLDVKGFSTSPGQERDKGTFALTGKQEKTNASINWQGSFNSRGVPGGALQLNNIQASSLLSFIDPAQAAEASGTATLHGNFSFDPTARNSGMATLIDATTEFHDLSLFDQKKAWLQAKTIQVKGTKFREKDLDLGSILLTESTLTLHQDKLPPFLKNLGNDKRSILVEALSFSGTALLYPQPQKGDKGQALQLAEMQIKANNLTARTNGQNNFEFAARVNQTGILKAQGTITLFPVRAVLSLAFAAIGTDQVAPWLPDAPLFQHSKATVHGKGAYRYPEAGFTGSLQLDDAVIKGSEEGSGLAVNKVELKDVSIKSKPLRIGMSELILNGPTLTWQVETNSPGPAAEIAFFLQGLISQPSDKKNQQKENGDATRPVIQKISFDNATITRKDLRLDPPWSSTISQAKGSLTNLYEKADSGASFDLSGLIDTVPFTLSGTADFLPTSLNCTSKLEFKGFPLLPLSAQITPLVDIDPKSGRFDLLLTHNRQNGNEQGEAAFLFSALRPSSAPSDTALALALLGDSQDQFKLQVPLAQNSAQPLLQQAIANFQTLVVKTGVAPFLLAGPEFADLQDRQFIPFPAGQSQLTTSGNNQEPLHRLATLLAAHPRLGLTLTGMTDPIHDRAAIQEILEEKERQRVAIKNKQRLQEWEQKQQKKQQAPPQPQSQGKIIEQNIPVQELAPPTPLPPNPVTVSETMLNDLAQERALQVYDYCTTDLGIASQRITLQEKARMGSPEAAGNQVLIGLKYIEPAGR